MLDSLRPIIVHMREFVADRRHSARHKAQRKARLLFSVSIAGDETTRVHTVPLEGFTRDISEIGLALIVPSVRIGDRYLVNERCKLRVVLFDLPTGQVEIHATPVRYQQLDEPDIGHLIGVHITEMSEHDRARLLQFLKTLH